MMNTKRLLSFLMVLVLVVGLLPAAVLAAEDSHVVNVRILDNQGNEISGQLLQIDMDQSIFLQAEVEYSDGSAVRESVQWSVSNSNYVSISANTGSAVKVTGKRQGTTEIIASYVDQYGNRAEARMSVDVRQVQYALKIRDIRDGSYVHGGTMMVEVGERFALDAIFYEYGSPSGVDGNLTWVSGDSSIISVDENNKFDPLTDGVTTLTASYLHNGQTVSASVTVKVGRDNDPHVFIYLDGVDYTNGVADVILGKSATLSAKVFDREETLISEQVEWSFVDHAGVLGMDGTVITGLTPGAETVVATYYDQYGFEYSAELYILVDDEVAHSISAVNCKVYNQAGEEVTSAMNGEVLTIVAQPPRSYSVFDSWRCYGTATVYDFYEETTMLCMGNSDITVEAMFSKGIIEIDNVTITGIDRPVEGRHPDFDAEIPADAGYYTGAPEGQNGYINGICWYDVTTGEYQTRDSVFLRDHEYSLYIIVMARDGYGFAQNDDGSYAVSGSVNLFSGFNKKAVENVPAHKAMYIDGNMYGTNWVNVWAVIPLPTYTITVENGIAYNASGEVITSAYAGETVTIVTNDSIGGREFTGWANTGDVEVSLGDRYGETTTFMMPAKDVSLAAEFNELEITEVHFALEGFYYGGMGNNLGVTCLTPNVMLMELDNGQNYSLFYDFDGTLGTTVSSYLYQDSAYCLRVQVLADYGCNVESLDAALCTVTQGDLTVNAFKMEYLDDGSALLYFRLGTAPNVDLYSINVTNGEAYHINQAVTQAPAGAKIYLVPTGDTFEGQEFAGWKVEYGNVTIETDADGRMYFIMPAEYVSLSRLTKGAIHHVYVDGIDWPEIGATPDFNGTLDTLEGFDFYPMEGITATGIVWYEQIDVLTHERLEEGAVFQPGRTYIASVILQALDGYYFYANEYGDVLTQCYINGSWAELAYINDEHSKYIFISVSYTTPQIHSITVEGGEAYAGRGNEPVEKPITSAEGGSYVKVVATEEGKLFSHWEIVSGSIKLSQEELYNEILYFGMPDEDVVIRAVYIEIPTLTLKNPTLAFEDEILYNVYFNVSDITNITEMGLVIFADRNYEGTVEDAIEMIPGYVANNNGTYTASTNGVPAKMLSDTVFFKVYAKLINGEYVYTDIAGYHAVAYANTILRSSASSANAKALVVAMLNYGAAAQTYFNYKTDALMNAGLTAEQQALVRAYDPSMVQDVVKADADKVGSFVMNGGYSKIWPTVSFEGAFSINYYFMPNQPMTTLATMSFADAANRTVFTNTQQVWEVNGVKVTNDRASSPTNIADYANPARFYASSNLTVEYPAMTKIEVACPTSAYAQVWVNTNTDANAAVSVTKAETGYLVTVTFTEPVDTFTLTKLSGQTRVSELKVTSATPSVPVMYYWDAETYASVDVLTAENATGTITMKSDGSNWYAAVEGIAAKAIDETIYVAGIYTSNGVDYPTNVIAYSLGNYCKTVAANGEAFGAATAVYGYYAKAYFAK